MSRARCNPSSGNQDARGEKKKLDLLPEDFQPGKWDVVCQRGTEGLEHVGNRRFRMAISRHLDAYVEATSHTAKSKIVSDIVESIHSSKSGSPGGFVRKDMDSGRWFRVGIRHSRGKVAQAFRDAWKSKRAAAKKKAAMFPEVRDSRIANSAVRNCMPTQEVPIQSLETLLQRMEEYAETEIIRNNNFPGHDPIPLHMSFDKQFDAAFEPTPLAPGGMSRPTSMDACDQVSCGTSSTTSFARQNNEFFDALGGGIKVPYCTMNTYPLEFSQSPYRASIETPLSNNLTGGQSQHTPGMLPVVGMDGSRGPTPECDEFPIGVIDLPSLR